MSAPIAAGSRVPFAALPADLRTEVGDLCGGTVDAAVDRPGGFSPGVAAVVHGPDGACFVKAVPVDANPDTPTMHRREADVLAALEGTAVRAPALRRLVERDGWVLLAMEAMPGANPRLPWRDADLGALVAALDEIWKVGTPCPVPDLAPVAQVLGDHLTGWRTLAAMADPGALPGWVAARLNRLADLEATWEQAGEGETLLHADVRGDNLLVHEGVGVLIDWPWACRGHALFDLVTAAPALVMQGGPAPSELLGRSPIGRQADPDRLRPLVAAVAGMHLERSRRPPPPGLPTVRAFQTAQGEFALAWLRTLVP